MFDVPKGRHLFDFRGKADIMRKKELRKILKERATEMSQEYIDSASADIVEHVVESEEYRNAQRIFMYVSMPREPQTDELINAALRDGKAVYVPRCIPGPEHLMEAVRIESLDDLESGSYGIREPRMGGELCAPEDLDLAIIPCMSAWPDGRRLGHGAGYYDRFLAHCRCPKMILCFEKMMDDRIEMDEHDIYMDVVVTETGATKI